MKRIWAIFALIIAVAFELSSCESAEQKRTAATERLVTQWIETLNAEIPNGNVERFLALWAEDAVQTGPRGNQQGMAELRSFFGEFFPSRISKVQHREISRVVQGGRAAVRIEWDGEYRQKPGTPVKFPMMVFLEFDESGKIKASHVYFDTATITKQLE